VVRDDRGRIRGIAWGYLEISTNNVAELEGLVMVLSWAIRKGWTPLVVEGDSKIIIAMAARLQNGSTIAKNSHN